MSAVRVARGTQLVRGVPVVVAGLVLVAALAGCSPMQASTAPGTHAAAARTTASGGTWGTAKEVPGIAALATDVSSYPLSVSCGAAGNCSAGGYYTTYVKKPNPQEAFVVSEKGGTWGTAKEVPGTAALNQGENAQLASVSCASAGNCSAGGYYTDGSSHQQAFVVGEANGTWGTAKEVPGFAALNKGVFTGLSAVSCASAGNCSAGGFYTDGSGHHQAFVVSEKGGAWGTAKAVPGTAALNKGGFAQLASVSCASAGNCSAGGTYTDSSGHDQAFVVSETGGAWGTAKAVPGITALNQGGNAQLASVSCPSAGNCSAGGSYYTDSSGHHQAFVVSETNGTWGTAKAVPGITALNQGGYAAVVQVSCASAGNCGAGGSYVNGSGNDQAFVVSEKGGTWGTAKEVPGTAALSHGGSAEFASVSCASAGNCSASGGYFNFDDSSSEVFVVSQTNGTWGTATQVPGFAALNQGGNAQPASVSCASAGHCSATGFYTTRPHNGFNEAFIVNET